MVHALNILLVEDNRIDRRALERLLEEYERISSSHAADIEGAIARLGERPFDCILLDWHLPDGNGAELLEHIAQVYPWMPVIVLTGDESVSRDALDKGAQNFMVKDRFDANELERCIVDAIEEKKNANTLDLAIRNDRVRSRNRRLHNNLLSDLSALELASSAIKSQLESKRGQHDHEQDPDLSGILAFFQESEELLTHAVSSLGELSSYADVTLEEVIPPARLIQDALIGVGDKKLEGITLHLRLEPRLPPLFGERQALSGVFEHLLRNASDAIRYCNEAKHHRITLTAYKNQDIFNLLITDTGPGVASTLDEKIFSPFFSLWPETRTGMGLTTSREVSKRHGGTLQLLEERPNTGARFQLRLPIATRASVTSTSSESRSIVILEKGTRLSRQALELAGITEIARCTSNTSALQHLREHPESDHVLCDFSDSTPHDLDELLSALEFFDIEQASKLMVLDNTDFGYESKAYLEANGGVFVQDSEDVIARMLGRRRAHDTRI